MMLQGAYFKVPLIMLRLMDVNTPLTLSITIWVKPGRLQYKMGEKGTIAKSRDHSIIET